MTIYTTDNHDDNLIFSCKYCDVSFDRRQDAKDHQHALKHKVNKMREDVCSDWGIDLNRDTYHVYCIVISPLEDSREFYYVGMASKPFERIYQHWGPSQGTKKFPSEDKTDWVTKKYTFVRLVDLDTCKTKPEAKVREREKLFEVSKEFDTNMVLGGR